MLSQNVTLKMVLPLRPVVAFIAGPRGSRIVSCFVSGEVLLIREPLPTVLADMLSVLIWPVTAHVMAHVCLFVEACTAQITLDCTVVKQKLDLGASSAS